MNIVSSKIVDVSPQIDNRAYVHEQHTDDSGQIHDLFYLSDPSDDRNSILAQHAIDLTVQLQTTVN